MRLSLSILFLVLMSSFFSQTDMYVHQPSGIVTQYPIDSIRKITFPTGQMQIHRIIGDTIYYAYPQVRMVNFSNLTTPVKKNPAENSISSLSVFSANGMLTVNFKSSDVGNCKLEIYDMHGKLLVNSSFYIQNKNTPTIQTLPFDLFSTGVYHCVVTTLHSRKSVKFHHIQ